MLINIYKKWKVKGEEKLDYADTQHYYLSECGEIERNEL